MAATREDPTGQAKHRRKVLKRLTVRLSAAEKQVKTAFRAIPRERTRQTVLTNDDRAVVYVYDLPTTGAIQLQADIRAMIDAALGVTTQTPPADWWYEPLIEQPYRQGTVDEIRDFSQLIAEAALTATGLPALLVTDPTDILLSADYLERLRAVIVRNHGEIKSLSTQVADQVIRQIRDGIQAGNTPTEIRQAITERFKVAESSAERIVRTEVNRAYNDARLEAADIAAERSGLRAGVLHISSLIPTTRATHAARHGNVYTPEQQLQWWNQGANRINCLCTTRSVLIDREGKVVDQSLQKRIKNEGDEFFDDRR